MVGSDSLSRLSLSTFPSFSGTLKSTRTMTRLPLTFRSSTKSFLPVLIVGAGLAEEGAGCRGWGEPESHSAASSEPRAKNERELRLDDSPLQEAPTHDDFT